MAAGLPDAALARIMPLCGAPSAASTVPRLRLVSRVWRRRIDCLPVGALLEAITAVRAAASAEPIDDDDAAVRRLRAAVAHARAVVAAGRSSVSKPVQESSAQSGADHDANDGSAWLRPFWLRLSYVLAVVAASLDDDAHWQLDDGAPVTTARWARPFTRAFGPGRHALRLVRAEPHDLAGASGELENARDCDGAVVLLSRGARRFVELARAAERAGAIAALIVNNDASDPEAVMTMTLIDDDDCDDGGAIVGIPCAMVSLAEGTELARRVSRFAASTAADDGGGGARDDEDGAHVTVTVRAPPAPSHALARLRALERALRTLWHVAADRGAAVADGDDGGDCCGGDVIVDATSVAHSAFDGVFRAERVAEAVVWHLVHHPIRGRGTPRGVTVLIALGDVERMRARPGSFDCRALQLLTAEHDLVQGVPPTMPDTLFIARFAARHESTVVTNEVMPLPVDVHHFRFTADGEYEGHVTADRVPYPPGVRVRHLDIVV